MRDGIREKVNKSIKLTQGKISNKMKYEFKQLEN